MHAPCFRVLRTPVTAVALALSLVGTSWAQAPRGQRGPDGTQRDDGNRPGFRRGQDGGGEFGGFGGGRGFGGMQYRFEPEFRRADMSVLVDRLALDDTQTTITEALLLDYESAFHDALDASRERFESGEGLDATYQARMEQRRAAGARLRERISALRESRAAGGSNEEEIREAMRAEFETIREEMRELRPTEEEMNAMRDRFRTMGTAWDNERNQLRTEFVSSMMSILTDTQIEAWPSFERIVRRRHSMGRGTLSAESVDLLLVLNEAGIGENERTKFADVIDAYELELDAALVARNDFLDENQTAIFDAMRLNDAETVRRQVTAEMSVRKAVRDVNESYAGTLAGLLNDRPVTPGLKDFEELYLERAFPQVHRPTMMQRSFEAVRRFDNVPPAFLDAIAGLEDAYLTELDTINDRLLAAIRAHEPEQYIERFADRMARMQNIERAPADDPIGDIRAERGEMEQRYRRQLESVLTEDQVESLPPMRGGRDFGARGRSRGAGNRGG